MRPNPLALAAVTLALLGAAVWYTRENPPADEDAAPRIVDLEEEEILGVTLRPTGDNPLTVVRNDDGEWQFGGGLNIPADDSSIGLMVASLASFNADRLVSEQTEDWERYGLESPGLSVGYEFSGGSGEIQFGRDTPTGSGVFARLRDDPRLFTVYSYNRTSFEKSVFDLRDKHLLQLDEASISSISVAAGGRTAGFRREDGDWRIVQPMELRADDFTVTDLVRAVRTAEMTEVLQEAGEEGAYSFDDPKASVEIQDEAGRHSLLIAAEGETYYARSSSLEGVYAVSSTLAESLDKPIEDYRNKKLFDFGYTDPASVRVRAGETTATVLRSDDRWMLDSEDGSELESVKVQTLLDGLRNLTATEFPSDRQRDQAALGLASPEIEAVVTPAGEGAEAETVVISSSEQTPVHAARAGEPSSYMIELSAAQGIVRALEDLLREPEDEGDEAAGPESGEAPPPEP